ncbi:MAG: DUF4469 domain-containing protein [Prevotellaceae bacterium]|jgi:hypothetical protein|nr:DUF4469 domain-containing protein [Prevotellaceae bacterium]
MLQYHLVENLMTPAPDDAMAQVVNLRSYTEEQIAEQMLKRGTLLTKADILAVLEVYREVILDIIADGSSVNTRLFNISPSISGVFNGMADTFDPNRHKIHVNFNRGMDVRSAAAAIKTEKVQVADPVPYIIEVKDTVSGSVNETLTPGGVVQLRGSRLKFITEETDNGIFLLPESGDEVKITVIVENKPARLIAMLPADLASGTYHLEVRTNYLHSGTQKSKQMKTGRFGKPLTV